MQKCILHFNNWAITGGVPIFIRDFALTFPEFQHFMCSLNNYEEYDIVSYVRDTLRYGYAEKISRKVIEEIDPKIVIFHNITKKSLEERLTDIVFDRRTICIHHNATEILGTDIDWFVSDYVKSAFSKDLLDGCQRVIVLPPCVFTEPYTKVVRPKRQRLAVGRIQSKTRGESPKDLEVALSKCDVDFIKPKIVPGAMPKYLSQIDILAIWQSGSESWSRVASEANLSGIPVVAYDRSDGLSEQITKTKGGILVDNEEQFIEAISLLKDEKLRNDLAQKGKSWLLENASQTKLRKEFLDTFLEWL